MLSPAAARPIPEAAQVLLGLRVDGDEKVGALWQIEPLAVCRREVRRPAWFQQPKGLRRFLRRLEGGGHFGAPLLRADRDHDPTPALDRDHLKDLFHGLGNQHPVGSVEPWNLSRSSFSREARNSRHPPALGCTEIELVRLSDLLPTWPDECDRSAHFRPPPNSASGPTWLSCFRAFCKESRASSPKLAHEIADEPQCVLEPNPRAARAGIPLPGAEPADERRPPFELRSVPLAARIEDHPERSVANPPGFGQARRQVEGRQDGMEAGVEVEQVRWRRAADAKASARAASPQLSLLSGRQASDPPAREERVCSSRASSPARLRPHLVCQRLPADNVLPVDGERCEDILEQGLPLDLRVEVGREELGGTRKIAGQLPDQPLRGILGMPHPGFRRCAGRSRRRPLARGSPGSPGQTSTRRAPPSTRVRPKIRLPGRLESCLDLSGLERRPDRPDARLERLAIPAAPGAPEAAGALEIERWRIGCGCGLTSQPKASAGSLSAKRERTRT